MTRLLVLTVLSLLPLWGWSAAFWETLTPKGWVSDYAGVIDPSLKRQMEGLIQEVQRKTGAEISVVTIPSLDGEDIHDGSVRLFERWKIGKKGKDTGVLVLASIGDRKMWITTGYGVEGILPDGLVGEIRDRYILPFFRQEQYGKGLANGVAAIAGVIAKSHNVELTGAHATPVRSPRGRGRRGPLAGHPLLKLLLLIILIPVFIRNPFLFLLLMGGGRGFGRGFGGGGFGGGFGGFGGGMTGGGGAGGGW